LEARVIFKPELAAKVMDGSKTVTRRLPSDNPRSPWWRKRCALKAGQTYSVQPGRGVPSIGRVRVERVRMERLGWVTEAEARLEGFDSLDEFQEAWMAINGSYCASQLVWRVEFRLIDKSGDDMPG
jgi:hypothetical protein